MNLGMESERVEFKKSTSELRAGVESIASILNKHGEGDLYFGVRPDGEVVGQDVSEKTLRDISQAIGNHIEPRVFPTIEVCEDAEGHSYIHVAFAGCEPPYSCNGRYRIRSADEDVPMSQDELARQFAYARSRREPWDTWESERPISDVDEEEVRAYVQRGNECGRIPFGFTNVENVLSRLSLIRNGKLTNAGEVLFCPSRTPQLKMGILESHARTEILDLHQESGTLFSLVRKAELYILNNTRRRFVIDDIGPRKEVPELPREAVREILMNAFTHRDWLSSAAVQIDIYHDAVEIDNPGWFIEGQDPSEHLSGRAGSSLTRNALLAQALYRCGDVESYGSGIPRVRDACASAGIEIEYLRTSLGTKFIFHRSGAFGEESQSALNNRTDNASVGISVPDVGINVSDVGISIPDVGINVSDGVVGEPDVGITAGRSDGHAFPRSQVLRLLQGNPRLTAAQIADACGLSSRQVERILAGLKQEGVIKRVGSRKAGAWEFN